MTEASIADKAKKIAKTFHKKHRYGDKSLMEGHLKKVASSRLMSDEVDIAVAYLHEILDRTPYNSICSDFGPDVYLPVQILTKDKDEEYADFILRIRDCGDRTALIVKISDLAASIDHLKEVRNRGRLSSKDREMLQKYMLAFDILHTSLVNRSWNYE